MDKNTLRLLLHKLFFNYVFEQKGSTIGEVFTGMPAWKGGLKPGDKILAVDSVAVSNWYEMRERIIGSKNEEVQLTVLRNGKILICSIALEENVSMGNQKMIGITQYMPVKRVINYNPLEAISMAQGAH